MKIIDISWPITPEMTQEPGEGPILFEPTQTFVKDQARETYLHFNAHIGTHVEAPSYLLRDGKSIDQISLDHFVGPANVIDLTNIKQQEITQEDLKQHTINAGDIILLKTQNSSREPTAPYDNSFVYLSKPASEYLVKQKIKTFGFDYITLEPEAEFDRAHRELLEKNIPIIEGLRLFWATPGLYFLFCLPLDVLGIEAAPARAVLIEITEENMLS